MNNNKARHSKFKNTGILFELLTRQITADILSNKEESPAKTLLFKYFTESKELGKELQLYKFLINERAKNESQAETYISAAITKKTKLDNKKLSEEKYNLIKEIKEIYPIDKFFKSSIKNYKVHASIYKLFEENCNNKCKFDINEVVQSRNCITEHLVGLKPDVKETKDSEVIEIYKQQNEEIRLLSYKILVDSLNEKYKSLDDNQKNILREYINNISNTNSLDVLVKTEIKKIKEELCELKTKVDSGVVIIKINEAVNQIDKLNTSKGVKDNHIMSILLGYELVKEIKKQIR